MSFSTTNTADAERRKAIKQELRDTVKWQYGPTGAREITDVISIVLERGLMSRREREALDRGE